MDIKREFKTISGKLSQDLKGNTVKKIPGQSFFEITKVGKEKKWGKNASDTTSVTSKKEGSASEFKAGVNVAGKTPNSVKR